MTAVMPYRYARESSSPPIAARESRAREEWWRFLESVTAGDDAGGDGGETKVFVGYEFYPATGGRLQSTSTNASRVRGASLERRRARED